MDLAHIVKSFAPSVTASALSTRFGETSAKCPQTLSRRSSSIFRRYPVKFVLEGDLRPVQ